MPEMAGLLLQSRTNTTMAATKGDYLFEASFRNSRVPQIMTTKATMTVPTTNNHTVLISNCIMAANMTPPKINLDKSRQ